MSNTFQVHRGNALQLQQRYRQGEWRSRIFCDLVIAEIRNFKNDCRVLDIGCGHGFDFELSFQKEIADEASVLIGIEPDCDIQVSDILADCHRTTLEKAPIEKCSIDVAYSVMVMEHINKPKDFFDTIHKVLRDGGTYWGFTVDRRHYFSTASRILQEIRLKEKYLNWINGSCGIDRYENYPTFYRCNSPRQLRKLTREFSKVDVFSLSRRGDTESCYPALLKPIFQSLDLLIDTFSLPGSLLLVRCQK
ncbi:class I SAM-dependent methyltransferase [Bythopirellula goksoeyrii]|uniref:Uncharacterized protein n=1 Tax=Bythopirellula goksoeyrii TaxID=1400387 RepID=A0A5B9QPZ0_9BACT|nr:methyltransferase domain-containing protein [Bythopirellula goksoeyrii]QEG36033.1 hypothetical protein Pr1d_33420 [Bythopirellula goksoeyrii]